MLVASQQHACRAKKDVYLQKKELFLLSPTVNLFGAEIRVAEILQVPKISLCFGINIGCCHKLKQLYYDLYDQSPCLFLRGSGSLIVYYM